MDEPDLKNFTRNPQRFEITWRGIRIEIRYKPPFARFYLPTPIAHLEVEAIDPRKAPLPITETGYRSHIVQGIDIDAASGPVAYVQAWLEYEAAKSEKWRTPPQAE